MTTEKIKDGLDTADHLYTRYSIRGDLHYFPKNLVGYTVEETEEIFREWERRNNNVDREVEIEIDPSDIQQHFKDPIPPKKKLKSLKEIFPDASEEDLKMVEKFLKRCEKEQAMTENFEIDHHYGDQK